MVSAFVLQVYALHDVTGLTIAAAAFADQVRAPAMSCRGRLTRVICISSSMTLRSDTCGAVRVTDDLRPYVLLLIFGERIRSCTLVKIELTLRSPDIDVGCRRTGYCVSMHRTRAAGECRK
jgi:hypothetical protein